MPEFGLLGKGVIRYKFAVIPMRLRCCAFRLLLVLIVTASASESSAATTLLRGPYLQMGTPTNIVVRWRTDTTNTGRVQFGTNSSALSSFADEASPATNHSVLVSNLSPNTVYFYTIGVTNQVLSGGSNFFFRTAPPVGSHRAFRAWVLGDFGFTNESAIPVRNAYYNFASNHYADIFLMLGDNAYHTGHDGIWQAAVFNTYSNVLRQTPVWSTIGNQETGNSATAEPTVYLQNFTFPTNAQAGGLASGTERYYSFDYGNVHFVCLDSMSSGRTNGSPMLLWLEEDLRQTTNEWLIAFWHHPPYSKGSNDSDARQEQIQMRTNAVRILEAYGVDLVLGGHSHSYERSYLIDGHYGLSSTYSTNTMLKDGGNGQVDGTGAYAKDTLGLVGRQGAVYAVAGSGAQVGAGSLNHPVMYRSVSGLGSMVLDIHANRLEAKFIRETGAIDDHFTIIKGMQPLRITQTSVVAGMATITWSSVADRTYSVEFSATLPATSWSDASGLIRAEDVTASWTGAASAGFYRIWSAED